MYMSFCCFFFAFDLVSGHDELLDFFFVIIASVEWVFKSALLEWFKRKVRKIVGVAASKFLPTFRWMMQASGRSPPVGVLILMFYVVRFLKTVDGSFLFSHPCF